ncbi:hypothetical protein D3C72_1076530 [compost metagenome]
MLPRARDTCWHDKLISEVVADTGYVTTATNDDNLLKLAIVTKSLIIVANNLASFDNNALQTRTECCGDFLLTWASVKSIKNLKLVGILERYTKFFGNIKCKGIASNAKTACYANRAVKYGDVSGSWANINNDSREMTFFGSFEHTGYGTDAGFDHADIKTSIFNSSRNLINKGFWYGAHKNSEVCFCTFDNFIVNIQKADRYWNILVDFNLYRIFKGILGRYGDRKGSRESACRWHTKYDVITT